MLTESFITCTGLSTPGEKKRSTPTPAAKDASIVIHTLPPLPSVSQIFKKGATAVGGLAVSNEHVFAAQADKAVVNVYSRERGNQECIVPFQEKVTALDAACDGTVVVMGTEGGRLMLWETCTGRLISTSAAHLQRVSCIRSSPDSNFIMSGSEDSTLHVWSIPLLLAFGGPSEGRSPMYSLTNHRASITALAISGLTGSGAIALSGSEDGTAIVWDYKEGHLLRTILLADPPTSLVLDPVDRGVFVGYKDGSVQLVDFYSSSLNEGARGVNPIHDSSARAVPLQPDETARWRYQPSNSLPASPALCLTLSFDGMTLLSGHGDGHVMAWDVGRRGWQSNVATVPGPVTNLQMLPMQGWAGNGAKGQRSFKVDKVVKPKFEMGGQQTDRTGGVPGNYTFTTQFITNLDENMTSRSTDIFGQSKQSAFQEAFACPTGFPREMLEESVAELLAWKQASKNAGYASVPSGSAVSGSAPNVRSTDDFMALDAGAEGDGETASKSRKAAGPPLLSLEEQNAVLKKKIAALQRVQRVSFQQLDDLRAERKEYLGRASQWPKTQTGALNAGPINDNELTAGAAEFVAADEEIEEDNQSDAEASDPIAELED